MEDLGKHTDEHNMTGRHVKCSNPDCNVEYISGNIQLKAIAPGVIAITSDPDHNPFEN